MKALPWILLPALFTIGLLCGRSLPRSAPQPAQTLSIDDKSARLAFREAVAALKVCALRSSLIEFRQASSGFATSYETHKPHLNGLLVKVWNLQDLIKACEFCWDYNNRFELDPLDPSMRSSFTHAQLVAMRIINPAITNSLDLPLAVRKENPDFYAKTYVTHALSLIGDQCDALLHELQ